MIHVSEREFSSFSSYFFLVLLFRRSMIWTPYAPFIMDATFTNQLIELLPKLHTPVYRGTRTEIS